MRRKIKTFVFIGVAAALVVGFVLNPLASATVPGNNSIVSLMGSGSQSSQDSVGEAGSLSRDGRFAVFTNTQNNFVGTDSGNDRDVFVRDLGAGTVTRVSVSTAGVESNSGSQDPIISETGRYVVFGSYASNLVDGRTISSGYQLYIRDTLAGTTAILSEVSAGVFANQYMRPLDVSTDGRFVLIMSKATNLGPTVVSGYDNIFLLDRNTSTFEWVNAQGSGVTYGRDTWNAQMSCDGSFIVFDSDATYLGLTYSSHVDVFLLDRRGGDKLTSITASANSAAMKPEISCNGNYIGFSSNAYNLDPNFTTSAGYHAYVYDRINDEFLLLDQSSSGVRANATIMNITSDPVYMSLSDNGKAVFGSTATNLDAAVTSGSVRHFYVRDTVAGTTELLTRDGGGSAANNDSVFPYISLDASLVGYESIATNLVSGDTNAKRDIFVSETGY